jgi:GTPase SAR1 family protein
MTNKPLRDRRFVHNFNLKNAIEEYCDQQETLVVSNRFLSFNICSGRTPVEWNTKSILKLRLSLLGGSNVGKTTLARCLQYGSQSSFIHLNTSATVGPDLIFLYLDQLYENKYVVLIQLADIPGMERYESCCDNHFRHCHGALLLSDSSDIDSFERTELYWYKQLQTKGKDHVEASLVCNKIDLFDNNCDEQYRRVFLQRAEHFASLHHIPIYYISALRGDNIHTMCKQLILRILQNTSLMKQIKETSVNYDHDCHHNESAGRRTSSIQVTIQPSTSPSSSLSSSSREHDQQTNSSGQCCKYA